MLASAVRLRWSGRSVLERLEENFGAETSGAVEMEEFGETRESKEVESFGGDYSLGISAEGKRGSEGARMTIEIV